MSETYTVTVEPLGRDVECRSDQTILDALLRNGVWVPHSCTHGTCATCKVEVVDGEVDHGESSGFALMDFERDEGKTLVCCAFPQSDVTIEADVDVDEDIEVHPVQDYTGTVVEMAEIATDTRRVTIELDRDLSFNAGQYMRIMVPGAAGEPRVDRTYSMANPPTERRRLEFQIRRVEGGKATDGWIFKDLAVGDQVALSGPYGRFVLKVGGDAPAVMVAGGTGLAPIAAMIKHALLNDSYAGHITLYAGGRSKEWLYDVDYFRSLEAEYPEQFTYRPCLSETAEEGYAEGLVTDVLEADHESLKGHQGYLCGPPAMVEAALKSLMSRRLFPRDIFREDFFNEADKATGGVKSPLIKR
ncbi:MAG: 2Fe-2S iron-sulfur cluster-binding protein [Austwickia sp.]|nr:2Fe-2S iron-sulfur cluster binding domain-containing protein [Actinomycetota bacterium]MCB1251783.1 2Fe-2S iron-sulfur cluster binding domain-containing protein [Austwickia sp.]MCO5309048.1 2Fe-2S iron-sulfur cluster-binding protein [Austwickia sp.]